jgi:hypothetical protein
MAQPIIDYVNHDPIPNPLISKSAVETKKPCVCRALLFTEYDSLNTGC